MEKGSGLKSIMIPLKLVHRACSFLLRICAAVRMLAPTEYPDSASAHIQYILLQAEPLP